MPNNTENSPSLNQSPQLLESESIYMERSGKKSRLLSEALLSPPEDPLSPEEAQQALSYESKICDYPISESMTIEELMLTHKSESHRYFPEAFLEGHVQVPGLEGQLRQHNTSQEVYEWLMRGASDGSISEDDFREMARQSSLFYKSEMKQALLRDERPPEELFESMSIVINPKQSIESAQATERARRYLMGQRKQLKASARGLEGAKRAFVDIYTKKINGLLAGDILAMERLFKQSQLIQDEDTAEKSFQAMPDGLKDSVLSGAARPELSKRLDYIKNGIGYDENGHASGADSQVFEPAKSEQDSSTESVVFSAEERELLREAKMDKATIREIFKQVLADAHMLSEEDESSWAPGRAHRAKDGLFQVVYQPVKNTMAVNGKSGVVLTPSSERSVYDVITVGVHELTHINQVQADQILGESLRIGALKGRRVSMLRESGANLVQRQLEHELFGVSKPVAYAYAQAIRKLESGGDAYDATKAFYEEKITSQYKVSNVAAATEAADRVLRLLASNGTNSQPMAYAEENIMNAELAGASPEVKSRATQITTLDLDDQLRLHRYGLLPEISNTDTDWAPILLKRMQPFIDEVLKADR